MKMNIKLPSLSKKQIMISLVILSFISIVTIGSATENKGKQNNENSIKTQQEIKQDNASTTDNKTKGTITYTIIGELEGEYGKKVVLNKNSNMPVTKYLYKLPAGTYKVTTSFKKMASFFIVKDQIKTTPGNEYPEEIDIVGTGYLLTAGDDDFNGRAKKEVDITLKEDESIQVVGNNKFFFEKR